MPQSARTIFGQSTYRVLPHARLRSQVRVHTQFLSQSRACGRILIGSYHIVKLNRYGHMLGSYQVEFLQSPPEYTRGDATPESFLCSLYHQFMLQVQSEKLLHHKYEYQNKTSYGT